MSVHIFSAHFGFPEHSTCSHFQDIKNCSFQKVSIGIDVTMMPILANLKEPHKKVGWSGFGASHKTFTKGWVFITDKLRKIMILVKIIPSQHEPHVTWQISKDLIKFGKNQSVTLGSSVYVKFS